jgi:crotonobetainyl-CoA:carnitine CoA-transferase CaiB-like acyl-CoA transferase
MLPLPLALKRVVDLTNSIAGASASQLLAGFGAEVILVEPPRAGLRLKDPESFSILSRNKLSFVIDLSSDEGWSTALALVALSDVVLTDSTDYGGEDSAYKAFGTARDDIIVVAIGDGSDWVGLGRIAAAAAMTALLHKRVSGEGQLARVGIREAAASMRTASVVAEGVGLAGASPDLSPSGCYGCSDGSLALVVRSEEQRRALLNLAGTSTVWNSVGGDQVDAVAAWTKDQSAEVAAARLREAGVSAEHLRRPGELQRDPHLRARGFFEHVAAVSGLAEVPGPAYRYSLTPTHTRLPAPALGEHNDYVLRELLKR